MLTTGSWVGKVKDMLGLEGVSQVWGNRPAWYFWISRAPGVYHLRLEDVQVDSWENRELFSGIFSLKCYPFPGQAVFETFSFEERALMRSDFFDDTFTPRFEVRTRLPDTLFNVATLEYTVDAEDTFACFTLESLDALRISYAADKVQAYPLLGRSERFAAGQVDRNVPAWAIGYPFFDRMLSLYVFEQKKKPYRTIMLQGDGFDYICGRNGLLTCRDTADTRSLELSVFFATGDSAPDRGRDGIESAVRRLPADSRDLVFDRSFPCGHFHHVHGNAPQAAEATDTLNPQWWTLADADYKSELATSCGCACDAHGH